LKVSTQFLAGVVASFIGVVATAQTTAIRAGKILTVENGRVIDNGLVLVRDVAQWAELWREHGSIRIPSPPAPEVDWSTRQVVALVLGQRSSGGYAVTIEEIRPVEGGWQVIAREDRPAPDAATTMALTSPYHFVVLEEKLDPDLGLELVLR